MEANIRTIAAQCAERSVAWRPHAKGHKAPSIAQKELDAGALGVTCAKLGEAEVMAAAGIRDLLIANLIVGPQKSAAWSSCGVTLTRSSASTMPTRWQRSREPCTKPAYACESWSKSTSA